MGTVIGASKVARDITERRRTEALQRLLMDELNHRVKNTLATVQAIANQTLRRAKDPADFAASLNGRVQALARAHTLLTETSWQGAELTGIVRDQLLLTGGADERISYGGPSLVLEPQAALHLAMVLHELATNARKYGALSVPGGSLLVTWALGGDERRDLILKWLESGGPKVNTPASRGYGTTLIEQSLRAHGGTANITYAETGLTCEIRLPRPEPRHAGLALRRAQAIGVAPVAVARAGPILRSSSVLLVEDEPLVAMEISSCLSDVGCEVVGPAGSVAGAVALIEAQRIDAALVDANLAGDRVDRLAELLAKRGIPFMFVTGYGREGLPTAFRETPIIGKPFTREQLLAGVARLLGRDFTTVASPKGTQADALAGT
jgi:two-component sensor histidine kinase/CheY-like chemotaxis protein